MYKKIILEFTLGVNLLLATNYNCVVSINSCQKEQEIFDITKTRAKNEALQIFVQDNRCVTIRKEDVNCSKITIVDKNLNNHNKLFHPNKKHTIVDILYATDRGLNKKAILEERYTTKRSKLKWGVAQVSLPHSHLFGEVKRPMINSYEKIGEDIVVTQLYCISKQRFNQLFQQKLRNVAQDDILVFIHGYNVTFANAIRQTAQLSYDLRFKGVPLTYSWTTKEEPSQYLKDEASVMYTVPKLVAFLQDVIKNKGRAKIHILAHSMGTRALANALKNISFIYQGKPQFKNVILVAPDVDVNQFESNLYPSMLKITENITIYSNSKDNALLASKNLHNGKKLGEGGANISLFKDVVSIDATGVDSNFLGFGHSSLTQKKILVNDLRALVHKSLPPHQRSDLIKKTKDKLFYWKFKL